MKNHITINTSAMTNEEKLIQEKMKARIITLTLLFDVGFIMSILLFFCTFIQKYGSFIK